MYSKKIKFKLFFYISLSILFSRCGEEKKQTQINASSPTTGSISLVVDESFKPLISAQEETFESLYPQAHLETEYSSEVAALNQLMEGKVDMIVIGKTLDSSQIEYFRKKNFGVRQNKIATDGLALVVDRSFPDTAISIENLKRIFSGEIKTLNELNSKLPKDTIGIVLDKSSSSNLSYMNERLNLNTSKIKIYAAGGNEKVLNKIENNKSFIGVIGLGFISDEEDPAVTEILKNVKIVGIKSGDGKVYYPYQNDLYNNNYPLTRDVYAIIKGSRNGLEVGFSSFMYSDRGQRIVLKSGLLPASMPGREIEVR